MSNGSVQESLSVPLLGVESPDTFSAEDATLPLTSSSPTSSSPPPLVVQFTWLDSLIVWFISPALLSLDFTIAFWLEPQRTQGLHPPLIYCSIVMFMLAAYLFRRTMEDMQVTSVWFILLPELSMDIVLTLVLFNQVVWAVVTLLVSILLLSTTVVGYSVTVLLQSSPKGRLATEWGDLPENHSNTTNDDDDDDAQQQQRRHGVLVYQGPMLDRTVQSNEQEETQLLIV